MFISIILYVIVTDSPKAHRVTTDLNFTCQVNKSWGKARSDHLERIYLNSLRKAILQNPALYCMVEYIF